MPKMIFADLPATGLERPIRFYKAIGCVKDDRFRQEDQAPAAGAA